MSWKKKGNICRKNVLRLRRVKGLGGEGSRGWEVNLSLSVVLRRCSCGDMWRETAKTCRKSVWRLRRVKGRGAKGLRG